MIEMQTIALREIRAAAGRPSTRWMRVAAGGGAALLGLVMIFYTSLGLFGGRTMFMTSVGFAFALTG